MSRAADRGPAPRATPGGHDAPASWRRAALWIAAAWLALLALLLTSLGSAYLRLGTGNAVAGLAIATVKSAIVVWIFMQLRRAPPITRIAAAVGVTTLLVLMGLSAVDYATRRSEPAAWQSPRQLAPGIAPAH